MKMQTGGMAKLLLASFMPIAASTCSHTADEGLFDYIASCILKWESQNSETA